MIFHIQQYWELQFNSQILDSVYDSYPVNESDESDTDDERSWFLE